MSIVNSTQELERLIGAFETESAKLHDLEFRQLLITRSGPSIDREFAIPNHAVMLWQFYGDVSGEAKRSDFADNLKHSDLNWGVRGAEISSYALLEGEACKLFVRLANRAGNLFGKEAAEGFNSKVVEELIKQRANENSESLPTAIANEHPLAIWLNYLLFHVSLTYPGRETHELVEPDPFTLSLLALERILTDGELNKSDRSIESLQDIQFKVALSFPGEKRRYVSLVAEYLRKKLGNDSVFYDLDYKAQLARPNIDTLLQRIYRRQSELVVIFLCEEYAKKEWCGLEWRAVRDIIKKRDDEKIMFVRFDNAEIEGVFSIDGYINGSNTSTKRLADMILERIGNSDDP